MSGAESMVRSQSAARRTQILAVSAELFAREGYHNTTISQVIEAAGIARGTFYLYFDGKRQLFDELLNTFLGALKEAIKVIDIDSDEPPLEQLKQNLCRVLEVVHDYCDTAFLMLNTIEAPDHEMMTVGESFFAEVRSLVISSIRTGMAIGLIRNVPEKIAAHFVFGAAKEVVSAELVRVRQEPGRERADAGELAKLAEEMVGLVAVGLMGGRTGIS